MTISPVVIGAFLDHNKLDPPENPNPDINEYYNYDGVYVFFTFIYLISIVLYSIIWILDRRY